MHSTYVYHCCHELILLRVLYRFHRIKSARRIASHKALGKPLCFYLISVTISIAHLRDVQT